MVGRRTPLFERQRALGAHFVPFAGWELPVQYGAGILAEHRAVRLAAGLFDVSHMGELSLRGPAAAAAMDWLCVNDPRGLVAGAALYTPLCRRDGGAQDDAVVYCLQPGQAYLFIVNAANVAADAAWMRAELGETGIAALGAEVVDESEATALLALQGPATVEIATALLPDGREPIAAMRAFTFRTETVAGVPCLLARTGYTGEDGFELACAPEDVGRLWDALLEAGRDRGLLPCGLGARDTLRLEAALPLYGHELDLETTPLEARLGRFVRVEGRRCCAGEALSRQAASGPAQTLVGLLPQPPAIARAGAPVRTLDGEPLGVVTSGTYAPTLGRGAALARCRRRAPIGSTVVVEVRGRAVRADVVRLPFYARRKG